MKTVDPGTCQNDHMECQGFARDPFGLVKQTEATFTNMIKRNPSYPAQESGVNKALLNETWWLGNPD